LTSSRLTRGPEARIYHDLAQVPDNSGRLNESNATLAGISASWQFHTSGLRYRL